MIYLLLTTTLAASLADGPFMERVERAWIAGSTENLLELREQIDVEGGRRKLDPQDLYALAYVNWRLFHELEDDGDRADFRDELLDDAQAQLELLVDHLPRNAEVRALLGNVLGEQIGTSAFKGMMLGP